MIFVRHSLTGYAALPNAVRQGLTSGMSAVPDGNGSLHPRDTARAAREQARKPRPVTLRALISALRRQPGAAVNSSAENAAREN